MKLAAVLIALLGAAIVGLGLWYQSRHPRRVVATGAVQVEGAGKGGGAVSLRTRTVEIGTVRLTEVEMPGGTWIDCHGDCRKAAIDAGPGFWDAQARDRGR